MKRLNFLNAALKDLELKCFLESTLHFDGFMITQDPVKELGQNYLACQEIRSIVLVLNRIHELCLQLQENPLEFKFHEEIERLLTGEITVQGQANRMIAQPISEDLLQRLNEIPATFYNFKTNASQAVKEQTDNPYTTGIDWEADALDELSENHFFVETLKEFETEMQCLLQLAKERQPAEEILASCFN